MHINDQLLLESVKSPGQYLHVSETQFGSGFVYNDRCRRRADRYVYTTCENNVFFTFPPADVVYCKCVTIHGKTPPDCSCLGTGNKNDILMTDDSCSFQLMTIN